jgi:hypothetical protein
MVNIVGVLPEAQDALVDALIAKWLSARSMMTKLQQHWTRRARIFWAHQLKQLTPLLSQSKRNAT